MQEPQLHFISLDNLLREINENLEGGKVFLEEFKDRQPKKISFLHRLRNREVISRGNYPLMQQVYSFMFGSVDLNLGYIAVETGVDTSSSYAGGYETLRLRIKHPLKLRDGRKIPSCSVKLLVEAEEYEEPYKKRRDHRRFPLLWIRRDLSDVLPTEWFFNPAPSNL